ncbi:MAG: DUF1674 domain-containing protein [Wenzhouxiangella sp.]|jgi:hypothetical protein|nr:DUF1674 domain-containing protein [Wenzhouxiangella sp.]
MKKKSPRTKTSSDSDKIHPKADKAHTTPKEHGGRKSGLEPTRYGDWEKNGRCIDF